MVEDVKIKTNLLFFMYLWSLYIEKIILKKKQM